MKTLVVSLCLAVLVAGVAILPATASASNSTPGQRVREAVVEDMFHTWGGAPYRTDVQCVTGARMIRETGSANVLGLTYGDRSTVLILNWECEEIVKWDVGGALRYGTVDALQTVMHEAQHAKGVNTEWVAECRAILPVLAYLGDSQFAGRISPGVFKQVREYLHHGMEKNRPPAYKLSGRC
jgi:hypothetical protein